MTDFVIDTAPFSIHVKSRSKQLLPAISELYPSSILKEADCEQIYDFRLDVKRKWAGLGRPYHVACGSEHFRMTDKAQLVPVFEWGVNWCVASYQHQYLAIHAAVLEKNGKALIMPAPPGSGKSTLCAVLMLEGWRLLSDEMCLVDLVSGDIVPYVRPVSLKNQSLELVKSWYPHAQIRQITDGTTKGKVGYLLPSDLSWQQYTKRAKAAWVVFPQYLATQDKLSLTMITQADAFMHLAHNSFNYDILGGLGFDVLSKLVAQVAAFRLEYASKDDALEELSKLC